MEYIGKNIPKLGFGLMRLPTLPGGTDKDIDLELVKKMVDLYLERGFTYFDTAYLYHGGLSEVAARECIVKRYPRERFQITDKMPLWDIKGTEDYERLFQEQLERTGLEYFDFYFLHGIGDGKLEMLDETGGWAFLRSLKERGLTRHIGFSFHSPASTLERILSEHPEVDIVQLQINYADWDSETVQSRLCYETARKHGKGVSIMEPIRGGSLVSVHPDVQKVFQDFDPNASLASWALRFCASLEGLVTILSGMSTLEQVDENTRIMQNVQPLSEAERAVIAKAVEALGQIPSIPCTGCKYCVNDCPQKINTPAIIEILNEYKKFQSLPGVLRRYGMMTAQGGKASSCVECRSCEDHCPQHLHITEILKEAAGLLEK